MKNIRQRLVGFIWFIFVLAFIGGMVAASFFLTAYLYKIVNLTPPLWLAQIVNALLGLLLTGVLVGIASRIGRSRGWIPEMDMFQPVLEALEKIAQGDFSIRLDNQFQDHEIVGELVNKVNRMASELDQMETMRQEFISNVSHEIQSPLTSIRGFAAALENNHLSPEERNHYLGIIQSESQRLARITEDLLKLAALESEQLKFEPKVYRLDKQVRELILACEPQWKAKDIHMEVSLAELEVTADEDLLSQVWINLLHNSVKFTPQAGSIQVTLSARGDRAEFQITDTGIGILEEDRLHIFERFYKADPSRTHSTGGSGLGLSIVKKIVEMHKGTIHVESRPGAGAAFTVSLPVK